MSHKKRTFSRTVFHKEAFDWLFQSIRTQRVVFWNLQQNRPYHMGNLVFSCVPFCLRPLWKVVNCFESKPGIGSSTCFLDPLKKLDQISCTTAVQTQDTLSNCLKGSTTLSTKAATLIPKSECKAELAENLWSPIKHDWSYPSISPESGNVLYQLVRSKYSHKMSQNVTLYKDLWN